MCVAECVRVCVAGCVAGCGARWCCLCVAGVAVCAVQCIAVCTAGCVTQVYVDTHAYICLGVVGCVSVCDAVRVTVCVAECVAGCVAVRLALCVAICVALCVAGLCHMLRVVPCVAVERGRDHHHDVLTLQQRAAVCCSVLQCAAYSPCTTCRVPSLPAHALLPLAVYPRPPLPRRQRYARFGLQ